MCVWGGGGVGWVGGGEAGVCGGEHLLFFLSHLLVAGCDIGVRFSVRPSVNIYVEVRHLCQS